MRSVKVALIAVAVTGAVGVGTGVAAAGAATAGAGAAPVQAAAPAAQAAARAAVHPAAAVAESGGQITAGDYKLWLTADGLHVQAAGVAGADVLRVADVLPGKVSTLARGDASGTLWAGIYRGPVSDATKITITLGGRTLTTTVTSLPGNPGWGVYYVLDSQKVGSAKPEITVRTN